MAQKNLNSVQTEASLLALIKEANMILAGLEGLAVGIPSYAADFLTRLQDLIADKKNELNILQGDYATEIAETEADLNDLIANSDANLTALVNQLRANNQNFEATWLNNTGRYSDTLEDHLSKTAAEVHGASLQLNKRIVDGTGDVVGPHTIQFRGENGELMRIAAK